MHIYYVYIWWLNNCNYVNGYDNTIRISLMPKLLTNVLFTRVCPRMKKPLTLTKCMYVSRHVPWGLDCRKKIRKREGWARKAEIHQLFLKGTSLSDIYQPRVTIWLQHFSVTTTPAPVLDWISNCRVPVSSSQNWASHTLKNNVC